MCSVPAEFSPALRRRSYLGLELAATPGANAADVRLEVAAVDPGAPAEAAGVAVGDVLREVAGSVVSGLDEARRIIAGLWPDEPAELVLSRGASRISRIARATILPLETLPQGRVELDAVKWRDYRLRAIWTLPRGRPPYPVVWFLPGAMWASEERPIAPSGSLLELVRGLTAAGFATLRVDRSGLGDSEGPLCTGLDLHAELEGWRAVEGYLSMHPLARQGELFLYARSLGGMLAPFVAASGGFRAIAVWGTSAERWDRSMLEASRRQYALAGMRDPQLATIIARLERLMWWIYDRGLTPEAAFQREPELRSLESESYRGDRVHRRAAAFFQQLCALDMSAAWRSVACPVLSLRGSSDWMSVGEHSARVAELAPRGCYRELAGIDHMMHARASLEEAFAEPFSGRFDPAGLDALVEFYRGQL